MGRLIKASESPRHFSKNNGSYEDNNRGEDGVRKVDGSIPSEGGRQGKEENSRVSFSADVSGLDVNDVPRRQGINGVLENVYVDGKGLQDVEITVMPKGVSLVCKAVKGR